jgi:hypothetical protein
MTTDEIGHKLVALCQQGKNLEAIDTLYSTDAESVEAMSTPEMPARLKGVDKIKEKNQHWFANNEVHEGGAKGPFPNGDRFAVIYNSTSPRRTSHGRQADADGRGGMGTVKGGKIVRGSSIRWAEPPQVTECLRIAVIRKGLTPSAGAYKIVLLGLPWPGRGWSAVFEALTKGSRGIPTSAGRVSSRGAGRRRAARDPLLRARSRRPLPRHQGARRARAARAMGQRS